MAVNTLLLDFRLQSTSTTPGLSDIERTVLIALETYPNFRNDSVHRLFSDEESVSIFQGPRESLVTLRVYRARSLVTITIEYFLVDGEDPLLTYDECKLLEAKWSKSSNVEKTVKTLPRVIRGMVFDVYFPTTDERLLEYDVDGVCFDGRSPFQHVQIFHSKTHGKMLVLDDDPNLAESDTVYTEYLMRKGIESYANSEILILGGGDGALLCELLKENPKNVIMIEIDEMVISACREHLRSLCEDVLDQSTGTNYEILIGDCLPTISEMLERGIKFDFIFGDLTTIPITTRTDDSDLVIQNFVTNVLRISFQILRNDGKYLTHGPGASGPRSAEMLEELIQSQAQLTHSSVEVNKKTAFVPSFAENWAFYAVQLHRN